MGQIIDWLRRHFSKKKDIDDLLLYPYLSEKEIAKNPGMDQYNLERTYSLRHYLTVKRHRYSTHERLKDFYDKQQSLKWVGIVAGIKMGEEKYQEPAILIEKVAFFNQKEPYLLDYHLWLYIDRVKYLANEENKLTLSVGDAIIGTSKIKSYTGPASDTKYGLDETIIHGAGIFVGRKKRSSYQTHLDSSLVSNYDHGDDWIAKLNNTAKFLHFDPNNFDFEEVISTSGHVSWQAKKSRYPNHFVRMSLHKKIKKKRQQKSTLASVAKTIDKKKKELLAPKGPLTRYRGRVSKITYTTDENNKYHHTISFADIRDELGNLIANRSYFIYDGPIIQLNQLFNDDEVKFFTKNILPTTSKLPGKIEKAQLLTHHDHQLKVPDDFNARTGYLIYLKGDRAPERKIYIEKYRAWALKNEGFDPLKEDIRSTSNELTANEICQKYAISEEKFHKICKKLLIFPARTINEVSYYSEKAVAQIEKEVSLDTMLVNLHRKDRPLITQNNQKSKPDIYFDKTVLVVDDKKYITKDFDKMTNSDIRWEIEQLIRSSISLYLLVKDGRTRQKHYISIKDITSVKAANTKRYVKIENYDINFK